VENLKKILRQTTGSQALAFRELFLKVPDRPAAGDRFSNVKGFQPI
jgi:hypothetical protein